MAITVKHNKVSTVPDGDDTSVVRPSDWNADHTLVGTIDVTNGGTGASTASAGLNNLLPSQTGNNGKVLSTDGINASWSTNGSGDVVGPASATDNAIARFDGTTGKLIQNSVVTMDDTGVIAGANLTSPKINEVLDANGNEVLGLLSTASATDYVGIKNGIGVGVPLHISSEGSSTNIGLHIQPKGSGLVTISDGTDFNKGIRFRSSGSAASAVTLLDAVSTSGRVITLPDATTTLVGRDTTDTLTNKTLTNPVISGGTINGTTIGATSATTVNATTLSGQTGVLRGTGNNLLLQSNTFNTTWTSTNATVATTVVTTDPFGGNNAYSITSTTNGTSGIQQTVSNLTAIYTFSVYLKAGTASWVRLFINSSPIFAWFNLSTGVLGTVQAGATATITSIGNGWYRCSISSTSNATIAIRLADADNSSNATNGSLLYAFGAQLEIGSTANTYIPTTTTAVYGTPTLSFSGVSTLGLESNGALFLQPAGIGAIQAQATTSTTAGGNARGANAVDWQTLRDFATKVASGTASVICGGRYNQASGGQSVTVGGNNIISSGSQAFSGGGSDNTNAAQLGFLGGGYSNNISSNGQFGVLGGGYSNTLAGFYNVIGGGFTNSGTSGSAVTTQSGTMNATTAVTLSGSNASIKVGQLITGTSITSFPATYVAAISGTSLTLSQAASGSSTSTLSFFTPHGVVVGGGNNQATGSYSFIGGGGDAGTAANRNVASGDYSVVVGGRSGTASGFGSFVGGGGFFGIQNTYPNTASGTASVVVGGLRNTAIGEGSFVGSGDNNTANANYSSIAGGNLGTARSIRGNAVFPACQYPISATLGVSQAALVILARQTTDATATALTSDNTAAGTINQVILPNNSAYYFKGSVIANVTGAANGAAWSIEGAIMRGANAASTVLIDTPSVNRVATSAGATAWVVAVTADTTNGGIRVTVTGVASTTIRWVCKLETTEVTF